MLLPMTPFTIRAVLIENKANAGALCPIKIVVTIKGKRSYKSIKERVLKEDWDQEKEIVKRSNKTYSTINQKIKNEIFRIESELREKQNKGERITIKNLKFQDREFCKYFQIYIDQRKGVLQESTLEVFENVLKKLKSYDQDVTLSGIDNAWLRKYHQYLVKEGLANNTVHKHWKKIVTVFRAAKNDGIVDHYPFTEYSNPVYVQTDRTYLTEEEVEQWENAMLKPMDDQMLRSGYYFLLGCYSGLRISDWRRFNKEFIKGDRIILRAKKNGSLISLPMHEKLKRVVDILLELGHCPVETAVNENLKAISKLCGDDGLTKTVTAHVARHSFAVRCAELDISPEVTAEFLGVTKKTVSVYYKITNRRIDKEFAKWDKIEPTLN